ncbi:MAG: 1-acyl-sn-glycerol-3-phosphate acyltransferase [Acidobacteria bacterium]|nr:1-acyl-sn-glycerol-3-phosphate acyltransferase [Acidobacteriota bacterium]
MNVAILGREGPLASQTRAEAVRQGHRVSQDIAEVVIYFPGTEAGTETANQAGSLVELEQLVTRGGFRKLVLRSHAIVYGANPKNPGFMTEDRVSLLPERAPESRWLRAEQIAARLGNATIVRLTNVLAPEEGDLIVKQLAGRVAMPLAGRDPQVQFISLNDAARALLCAAESDAAGIFNASGGGALPLKKAYRAAGTSRLPAPKNLQRPFRRAHSLEPLEFNWTVSGERAAREWGFRPEQATTKALAEYVKLKRGAHPELLAKSYDPWGLDEDYIRAWGAWFAFLRKVYWRIDFEGMEHIPAAGRAMFVSNHRGFMPLDAVMHLSLALTARGRIIRFLIIPCLLYFPFLSNFLTKLGGVIASQENAARLFEGENLVGMFPEGIRGTFTPYKSTYQLRDFTKSAFAQLAIEYQTPIIPVAVIGHAEIFPIIGRIDSTYLKLKTGWPYFPIAPPFPFLPLVPLPSKWHVRVLEPVPVAGLAPEDARNEKLVRDLSRHVQTLVQQNINHMLARRKHVFWGKVLDGTAPAAPPFQPMRHALGV